MALISKNYPMNVSPNWLKQIDIAENGTTEQKIALAGSDEILGSIQLLFALEQNNDVQVRISLSKNKKLTNIAKRVLSGDDVGLEDFNMVSNEEMCRTLIRYIPEKPTVIFGGLGINGLILQSKNLSESLMMEVLDNGDGLALICLLDFEQDCGYNVDGDGVSVIHTPKWEIYGKMTKKVQLKLIDLIMDLRKMMQERDASETTCWVCATQIWFAFLYGNFRNMDIETQIYMAEKFVKLYKDIKSMPNHMNGCYGKVVITKYVQVGSFFFGKMEKQTEVSQLNLEEAKNILIKRLRENSSLNITAKTILGQI